MLHRYSIGIMVYMFDMGVEGKIMYYAKRIYREKNG